MSAQPRRAAARPPAPADPGPGITEEEAAEQAALRKRGHGKPLHELTDDEQAARQEWVTQVARDAGMSGEEP